MANISTFGQENKWKTHFCSDIYQNNEIINKSVSVAGWVHFFRDKGKLIFIRLRDATGFCQITFNEATTPAETFKTAKELSLESVITVNGLVIEDSRAEKGVEISPQSIILHSKSQPKLPLDINQKIKYEVDTEFKYRELSIRTTRVQAIMIIKSEIAKVIRSFFCDNGFREIFTPYILTTATEGGAAKFELDYFGHPAVLAQSCQFYKQAAIQTHEKVFGIIPSWRAEKSRTPKHITEFHQIENEIAFGSLNTIMEIQENLVYSVIVHVKNVCKDQLMNLNRTNLKTPTLPLPRITFLEAKHILKEKLGFNEPEDQDFTTPEESALSAYYTDPFFITAFPSHLRGIYYESNPLDEKITDSCDLVAPEGIGELSSGGQRVASKEKLQKRLEKNDVDPQGFEWYLRMFEYGFPPHAGYGLGFERLVRWICGLDHIREAIMFPRTPDIFTP